MGGFTRPRDLRSSNWFPGGAYVAKGKVYESPPPAAYTPHTVYLLESRYPVNHGVGRVDCYEHIVGVCREGDFEGVLKKYNSPRAPAENRDSMDNARWPWLPQKRTPRIKWWGPGENPKELMQELNGMAPAEEISEIEASYANEEAFVDDPDRDPQPGPHDPQPKKPKPPQTPKMSNTAKAKAHKARVIAELAGVSTGTNTSPARPFHTSSTTHMGHNYNEDHIVPDFYVQRKQSKATADSEQGPEYKDRKTQDSSLMDHLSDGALSDEIAASTRRLASKIPKELYNEEGVLVHPSGFVIPTPGKSVPTKERRERERDLAQQTAAVAERVLEEDFSDVKAEMRPRRAKVPFEVKHADGSVAHPSGFTPPTAMHDFKHAPAPAGSTPAEKNPHSIQTDSQATSKDVVSKLHQREAIEERKDEEGGLMSGLSAGILSGDVSAATEPRPEKVPAEVEVPGEGEKSSATQQPSGFVPPTPGMKRGLHTTAVVRATEVPLSVPDETVEEIHSTIEEDPSATKEVSTTEEISTTMAQEMRDAVGGAVAKIRDQYLPTLKETPFWRPLLTVTCSTRPLAVSLARLSRGRVRGTPYHATIDNDDRKCKISYSTRMRCMRLARMHGLSVQMAQLLTGARGGFIGIRFNINELGRGINGEGLEKPIDWDKRVLRIGVGNWYEYAETVKEEFRSSAEEEVDKIYRTGADGKEDDKGAFEVYGLDDHGKRISDETGEIIPWVVSDVDLPKTPQALRELWAEQQELHNLDADDDADDEAPVEGRGLERNEFKLQMARRNLKMKKEEVASEFKEEIALYKASRHSSVTEI